MAKKYKNIAPLLSSLMTDKELDKQIEKVKKDKAPKEEPVAEVVLTKKTLLVAVEYAKWFAASFIPAEYQKYSTNGPFDAVAKIKKDGGDITVEQFLQVVDEVKQLEFANQVVIEPIAPPPPVVVDPLVLEESSSDEPIDPNSLN